MKEKNEAVVAEPAYEQDEFTKNALASADRSMRQEFKDTPWTSVFLPRDEGVQEEKQQYVEVGYNGKVYTIRRGEDIAIPVPLYTILWESGRFTASIKKGRYAV